MSGITEPAYRLDEQQRDELRDCLKAAGLDLQGADFEGFVGDVEWSMAVFRQRKPTGGFRQAHDALRAIWRLAHEDDPRPALLRQRIRALPIQAIEYVNGRTAHVIPRLFSGDTADDGFLAWAEKADGDKLVSASRVITAEGARLVQGRTQGKGRRSRPRLEPVIFGEIRGSGAKKQKGERPKDEHRKGGRPTEDLRLELVMHLAIDWLQSIGKMPKAGRNSKAGFGDLVHRIFDWLEIDDADSAGSAATYALRRYWATVKSTRARNGSTAGADIETDLEQAQSDIAIPQVCLDCKWFINQDIGGSDRPFFCQRLELACDAARASGAKCGPDGVLFEPTVG